MRFYAVLLVLFIVIGLAGCWKRSDAPIAVPPPSDVEPIPAAPPEPQVILDRIVTARTFTLEQIWSQPLIGVDAMALLPDETPRLLVPYEGNLIAVLDLLGNIQIKEKESPEGLEDSIVMDIHAVNFFSGKQRIGVVSLDGKFYLFDEAFQPIAVYNTESDEIKEGTIRDFQFIQHQGKELLLLGIQQNSVRDDATANGMIHAVDLQGSKRWECPFEGTLNQISSAVMDDQVCALVSCTASQDQDVILVLAPDGTATEPVNFDFGRHILWFQVLYPTIYTLVLNTDGDVRFVGFDMNGKAKWSRLLPTCDYEVEPVYMPKEKKWLVPSPSGEIFVFDMIGNMIDTFSLDVVPTGLICAEMNGDTVLLVADGEMVSAWQVHSHLYF